MKDIKNKTVWLITAVDGSGSNDDYDFTDRLLGICSTEEIALTKFRNLIKAELETFSDDDEDPTSKEIDSMDKDTLITFYGERFDTSVLFIEED